MGDTVLKSVEMRPGIIKDLTKYMAEGGFVDCDKIRFRQGRAEKLGGWSKETVSRAARFGFSSAFSSAFEGDSFSLENRFTGVARDIKDWVTLANTKSLAVASNSKVELLQNGLIFDITPVQNNVTLANIMTTTSGSSLVSLAVTAHGAQVGDYLSILSFDSPLDGIHLAGEYTIQTVTDANHFIIDARTSASGSTANGGGTLNIQFRLSVGSVDNSNLTGWGGGYWGANTWGSPRTTVGGLGLRQWSLDLWGEDLLACPRNGAIYQWDATNGATSPLVKIATAPATNLFLLVAQPARIVIAFGSETFATGVFDPLIIRWAAEETTNVWTIDDTSNAGEYRLSSGNQIIGAIHTRDEILVFTDTETYSMRFIGGIDVFEFRALGSNTSVQSQHSGAEINGVIYWLGHDNFYVYDGVIRILPCTLSKFFFKQNGEGRPNTEQKEKIYCGINNQFNELWWFYPRYDETECGHYIKYNFVEQVWDFGTLERTVWIDRGVFERPYAVDADGFLFVHEQGNDDDSVPMESFITTAYFDINDGTEMMFMDRIVPDLKLPDNKSIAISVFVKKYPHAQADVVTKGPFIFSDTDHKISLRARGRQMALEFRSNVNGGDFEIGKIRVGFQTDGER